MVKFISLAPCNIRTASNTFICKPNSNILAKFITKQVWNKSYVMSFFFLLSSAVYFVVS